MKKIGCGRSGFTLVELLIVVGIITVLTISALFGLSNATERAKVARALSDIQEIRQAVEAYHADMGFYPPDVLPGIDPGLADPLPSPTPSCLPQGTCQLEYSAAAVTQRWKGSYIEQFPLRTPWGGKYDYEYWAPPIALAAPGVCAAMPNGVYVSIRAFAPNPPLGLGAPSAFAENYFRDKGFEFCPTNNGVIYVLVKRL